MAKVEQIMQPSQRELFFTPLVVLVEGTEDIAFISMHLQVTGWWTRFRELGCHFVVTGGKSPMSRPTPSQPNLVFLRSSCSIGTPTTRKPTSRKKNAKDNSCILRLCRLKTFDPLPADNLWGENVVMWKSSITNAVREGFADGTWDDVKKKPGTTRDSMTSG